MNARKLPTVAGMPAGAGTSIARLWMSRVWIAKVWIAKARIFEGGAPGALASEARASTAAAFAPVALVAALAMNPVQAFAQEVKGDPKAAEAKIGMCIGCHAIPGYKASYPMVYSVPMISGQSVKYIENALAAYRAGTRSHPTMRAIAGSLTDQDIADLAAYYGKPLEKK